MKEPQRHKMALEHHTKVQKKSLPRMMEQVLHMKALERCTEQVRRTMEQVLRKLEQTRKRRNQTLYIHRTASSVDRRPFGRIHLRSSMIHNHTSRSLLEQSRPKRQTDRNSHHCHRNHHCLHNHQISPHLRCRCWRNQPWQQQPRWLQNF